MGFDYIFSKSAALAILLFLAAVIVVLAIYVHKKHQK